MSDAIEVELPPVTSSPGIARLLVAQALTTAGLGALLDAAQLLVSELVTNAVLHGDGRVRVRVTCRDASLRVEVADSSAILPRRSRARIGAATGYGLKLVETLASAWGFERQDDGKVVWFDLHDEGATT